MPAFDPNTVRKAVSEFTPRHQQKFENLLPAITHTLRRLHEDVSATHVSVLGEVARYKVDKRPASVLEKYQRIVWWMQQYIAPMLDVIKVDGPMQATFTEVEEVLESASANALVISVGAAERNLRLLRVARRHALNVFDQCGKEISPLYQSLARSSNLATGAAWALDQLRLGNLDQWMQQAVVGVFSLRQQAAFSDKAITGAIERVLNNPPAPAPVVSLAKRNEKPAALEHRRWLDSLPEEAAQQLPNRRAVIQTAKKLGFIAITAAPSAVGEVDACYFLEPDKRGRVVLTDAQRLVLKSKVASTEK